MVGRRTGRLVVAVVMVLTVLASAARPAAAALTKWAARTWGTNGRVLAILPVGDRVFVGGEFTHVVDTSGVSYPAKNIAVFSATTGAADLSFDVGTNNTVTSLSTNAAAGGSTLYIGGSFASVSKGGGRFTRVGLAAVNLWTGAVSDSWAPALSSGQADNLAYDPSTDTLYAVGNFTSVTGAGGTATTNPYIAKIDATSGAVDVAFAAAPDDRARAVALARDGSNRLFVGGDFTAVSGAPHSRAITAVDKQTGAVDPAFDPGGTNLTNLAPVLDIAVDSERVYVGATGTGGACTALASGTGTQVWSIHSTGNLQAVRLIGSTLYCGGHFGGTASFGGLDREKLAAVVAATGEILSFNPRVNSSLGIWSLGAQADDPNLYAGGDFTKISGEQQPHFAQFVDTTRQTPPQPPTALVAEPDDSAVNLSWSAPSSDGGTKLLEYHVFRRTSDGGYDLASPLAVVSPATRVFSDTSVVNDTAYSYVVTAVNKKGASVPSAEASATPSSSIVVVPPSAPTSVVLDNPPGSMQLTWNPPADSGGAPVTAYNVYRSTSPGGYDSSPYASVSTTSYEDLFDLVAGTTYYYTVSAVNSAGEGDKSAEVSAVMNPGKPRPPELSGEWDGTQVVLNWTVPPDGGSPILKYHVLRDGVRIGTVKPPTTTYVDTTGVPGATHVYQVRAVNEYGGQNSNKVSITIPAS